MGRVDDVKLFTRIVSEDKVHDSPTSGQFFVVGTGVSAAATGNQREATWLGLVRAAIEHIAANIEEFGDNIFIRSIVERGVDKFKPSDDELWIATYTIERCLRGPEATKRWIAHRMMELESNVIDTSLVDTLGAFQWPIATTNYDNILCERLGQGYMLIDDVSPTILKQWRENKMSPRRILHLHGHRSIPDGLLFTKEDYGIYTSSVKFRNGMDLLFEGRPIFIGCKDTLIDSNIGAALSERFKNRRSYAQEPIVLLRRGETMGPGLAVHEIHYGEQHEDLVPFLSAALQALGTRDVAILPKFKPAEPHAKRQPSGPYAKQQPAPPQAALGAWQRKLFSLLASDFKFLRLPDFRLSGREASLTLDDIYVALTFDPRSSQERLEESRALHHAQQEGSVAPGELLVENPHFRRLASTSVSTKPQTLAGVIRDNRCVVMLGDPGSGKTTLMHWLTRQCAIARQNDRVKLIVEARRIDPGASSDSSPVLIGPAWFPVNIPISDYSSRRRNLEDGIGSPLLRYAARALANRLEEAGFATTAAEILQQMHAEAAAGRLLILIDGLDEDFQAEDRRSIVTEIELLLTWLHGESPDGKLIPTVPPNVRGNNRMVVTSRVAGYKDAPLSIDVPHFFVEPLSLMGAERLITNLFAALETYGASGEHQLENVAPLRDRLLRQLRDPNGDRLRALVTTPVLASALFTQYLAGSGKLPGDRRGLYESVIDLFMRREALRLERDGNGPAIEGALRGFFQELAFETFKGPESGLINDVVLKTELKKWLAVYDIPIPLIGQGVSFGPLVAKMSGGYGFLHRTFQEYFCAEYLTQDRKDFAQLVDLAGMPSWSEPARLGFMIHLRGSGPTGLRDTELDTLKAGTYLGNAFRPLALALAAAAESEDIHPDSLSNLVALTISILADVLPDWTGTPVDIAAAFKLLVGRADGHDVIEDGLEAALRAAGAADAVPTAIRRGAASARLVVTLDLFSRNIVEALRGAYRHDEEAFGWPVTRALMRAATPDLKSIDLEKKDLNNIKSNGDRFIELDRRFQGRGNLAPTPLDAVQYLSQRPQWLRGALENGPWSRLLTALLGGQRDYGLGDSARTYGSIAGYLQMPDQRREELFGSLPVEWMRYVESISDEGDIPYKLALFLDRDDSTAVRAAFIPPLFRLES
jgi:hypothetical protein